MKSLLNPRSPITLLLGAAAGFGADMILGINKSIDSMLAPMTPATATTPAMVPVVGNMTKYLPTAVEAGLGAYFAFKKRKSTMSTLAGGALLGLAAHRALVELGIMNGYQSVPVIGGYQSTPVIGGVPAQLQGIPGALRGYRVNGYASQGSGVLGSADCRNGSGYMN